MQIQPEIQLPNILAGVIHYLKVTLLSQKNFFTDIDSEQMMWAFNQVDEQYCFANISQIENDTGKMTEFLSALNRRRCSKISLLTVGKRQDPFAGNNSSITWLKSKAVTLLENELTPYKETYPVKVKRITTEKDALGLVYSLSTSNKNITATFFNLKKSLQEGKLSFDLLYKENPNRPDALIVNTRLFDIAVYELVMTEPSTIIFNTAISHIKNSLAGRSTGILIADQKLLPDHDQDTRIVNTINYYQKNNTLSRGTIPPYYPRNAVLKTAPQYQESITRLQQMGLPKHNNPVKNWDTLAFLSIILRDPLASPGVPVLDISVEYHSPILNQLAAYGFKNLFCINYVVKSPEKIGAIHYQAGSLINTVFKDNSFQYITCQGLIANEVDTNKYLSEMSRILKPGGLLMTSTAYWIDPINTQGKRATGMEEKIFTKTEIEFLVENAVKHELDLLDPFDYSCEERVVHREQWSYTLVYFTFRKKNNK